MEGTPINPLHALRMTECTACGYSLQGLDESGTCPECGALFNQQTIVLRGYARGQMSNVSNARPFMAFVFAVFPLFYLWRLSVTRGVGSIALAFLIGWICLVVFSCIRRWRTHGPGLVQVHLSAAGCLQRNTFQSKTRAA
jgi:hypothetical protein